MSGAVGSIVVVCLIDMVNFLSHPDGVIAGLAPKGVLGALLLTPMLTPSTR